MKKILLLFLVFSVAISAQTIEELFSSANTLYKNEKYKEAIVLYQQIEAQGMVSSELYYNLGNCYYKINKVAPTIYNYEKALQLNPINKDAYNNLVFAKRLTLDRIEPLPKTVLQKINQNYLQKLSYNSWGILAVIFSFITAILFLLYHFLEGSSKKRLFFTTSIVSFFLLIFTLIIAYNQYAITKSNTEAIIFTNEVVVKNEPTKNSDEAFTLHEGTKVNILDTVENWKKIKLSDGKIGWMYAKDLKQL